MTSEMITMSARCIVGCVEAKICFVNTAHGQCPKQGRTWYAAASSDPLTTLQSVFVCLTLCSVAQSTPRSTPVRRTKSQSSEMDVLALDPATTAYLQACGHQEALVAALEGPDLSHGLDQTDKVGGEGRAYGKGKGCVCNFVSVVAKLSYARHRMC